MPFRTATRHPRRRRLPSIMVAVTVAATVTLGASPAATAAPADSGATAVVRVTGGSISGTRENGVVRYLGVPFAASTAGGNRFAPPRPAPSWDGVRPALTHGPQCPQSPPIFPASEDCLSIDLYMPEHPAGPDLPVMVWLYGGAFLLGANAQYDSPARLVRDGQVIVAIPNYRVGPFGFMALPELADRDGGIAGTYGTLDQQAALRWIRDNAANFGGDSANVTLFGESAGGMSVCTQLTSPGARGLYSKAIVESGSCARSPLAPPSTEVAFGRSADYAASMGCADPSTRVSCLRGLPIERLLDSPTTSLNTMKVVWSPVRDGVVITANPEDALAEGAARGIPLVVGSNADEGATFIALLDYARGTVTDERAYRLWVQDTFSDNSSRVLERYPASMFASPTAAEQQVITDGFFACPAQFTTEAARRGGARVWQYRFNAAPLGYTPLLPGAFHAAEVPFVFSALMGVDVPLPPDADQLSQRIQQSWAHFAHTGDPEIAAFTPWPETAGATLELGTDAITVADDFSARHRCEFWSTIPRIG